jgi:hypothetical protein
VDKYISTVTSVARLFVSANTSENKIRLTLNTVSSVMGCACVRLWPGEKTFVQLSCPFLLSQSRFDDEDLIQSVFFAHLLVSHVSSCCAVCVQKIRTQKAFSQFVFV